MLRCWVDVHRPTAPEHYPNDDVINRASGSQYFHHCHRPEADEHGHLHLFARADAAGRWRGARRGGTLTHLVALGLDARGLPLNFFTVNQWVTDDPWFDAARTLALLGRFHIAPRGPWAAGDRWLNAFVALYRPAIARALALRDARVAALTARRPWSKVAIDRRVEVRSSVRVDWAADLRSLAHA